jgi:hypothetical protein
MCSKCNSILFHCFVIYGFPSFILFCVPSHNYCEIKSLPVKAFLRVVFRIYCPLEKPWMWNSLYVDTKCAKILAAHKGYDIKKCSVCLRYDTSTQVKYSLKTRVHNVDGYLSFHVLSLLLKCFTSSAISHKVHTKNECSIRLSRPWVWEFLSCLW